MWLRQLNIPPLTPMSQSRYLSQNLIYHMPKFYHEIFLILDIMLLLDKPRDQFGTLHNRFNI